MCRGNCGQPVYADKKDREAFLRRLGSVARAYKIPPEAMMKAGKGRGGNEARQVALWLARERCGAHATLRNMGKAMGGIGRSRFPWHATGSHAAEGVTRISEECWRGCHDMW